MFCDDCDQLPHRCTCLEDYVPPKPRKVPLHTCTLCRYETEFTPCGLPCV